MTIGSSRYLLTAPSVLCLNEKEQAAFNSASAEAQSILFLPSHINSSLTFDNLTGGQGDLSESAYLDRYFLKAFTERNDSYHGFFHPGPQSELEISAKAARLFRDYEDSTSPFHPCQTRSSLIDLLMFVSSRYRESGAAEAIEGSGDTVLKVISHITAHYCDKLTVEELCGLADTNRNTLSRDFKKSTGFTLIEYITRTRIDMASRLLRETSLPAGEILFRVGFNDPAHFNRAFKKITGTSPSAYRESFRRK
jgi:AraC family L-rhamnose operon regulatory protein RhaS